MTTAEIASFLNGKLSGSGDVVIHGVAKIEEAGPQELTFVANPRYVKYLDTTGAGAVLVGPGVTYNRGVLIEVADPYAGFLLLLEHFHPVVSWLARGVHPTAVVDPTAVIGADVSIGAYGYVGPRSSIGRGTRIYPHAVISADVSVGEGCEIHSHVTVRERVILGDRVVIQDGAVIGSDGFGFAPTPEGYRKIPQLGRVIIANDVEVGANTTVDRATLGETVIGKGTKLDNLIQVAHNVTIGSDTVIAALTGISGSAKIGDRCRIGGQVGVVGHLRVGDDVQIGAQSGVAGDVADHGIVSGSPARSHALWKRIEAALSWLPDLLRRVRKLETAVFSKSPDNTTRTPLS
jgi:UDP-3-O-[3-hydroxymyristoyl] glucosamine N-acyltransferase